MTDDELRRQAEGEWIYCGGELASTCVRTYRHRDGRVGKVVRTRHSYPGHFGLERIKYFVWKNPDTEFDFEAEAREAEVATNRH